MHFAVLCLLALCSFASARDQPVFVVNKLPYDQIKPFPAVEPDCLINDIALRFQPQLYVSSGCHPYPAVDPSGYVSNGLGVSHVFTDCLGSPEGSQVYGRAYVYKGYLVIMYAWYVPRDFMVIPFWLGNRHGWEHATLWFGGYTEDPKLLAVAAKSIFGYRTYAPPKAKFMDGDSFKLKYSWKFVTHHYLSATKEPGQFQDLIMWNNMTEPARRSLKPTSRHFKSPLSDNLFFRIIRKSYPF